MTIQIGMVGTDGILLAGDTNWITVGSLRQSGSSSKIVIDQERGMAIAHARHLETGRTVAKRIIGDLKESDLSYPELPMEKIALDVLGDASSERRDIELLIALTRPTRRLFFLSSIGLDKQPTCMSEGRKKATGDNLNSAIFFSQRYFRKGPIRDLVPLAAQVVIVGAKLNSAMIEGLEIVLCDDSGIHRISDDSIEEIQTRAMMLDKHIERSLFKPQEFTYVPDVIG